MIQRSFPGILFLAAVASPAWAANPAHDSLGRDLTTWQLRHGARWSAKEDPTTGFAELVYGARAVIDNGTTPRTDDEWIAHAERALAASSALHGIDVATLQPERALLLPLGLIGSGDKWTVKFRQSFNGVPVVGGTVDVLFDASGALLAVHNKALPDLSGVALEPVLGGAAARDVALQSFAKHAGLPAARITEPKLVVAQIEEDGVRHGRLAWQIDVQSDNSLGTPTGFTYWVDAVQGYVVRRETSVHNFDISGTISTKATPGTLPDSATNPPTVQPAKYIRIQNGTVNTVTDGNGNFTIPGVNTPQNVTLTYDGTFAHVDNNGSAGASLAVTLNPGSGNAIVLNPGPTDTITSQANIFNCVSFERDYVRRINPSDSHADIVYTGHANLTQTCNAYYDGVSINFFAAGGGCVNTAYSTVVGHEQGHWLNDIYGTGNGGDGMGEGNADVWSMYVYDNPITGEDFFTNGNDIRSGLNTVQFCGDCNSSCYGEVHSDGKPWMGAAWKVRANLDTSLGNTAGDLVADQIFLGWMNGFDQTEIKSVIELQWLLLDDNDANLSNGTPHSADIMNGFRVQGFPGYFLEVSGTTVLADQTCEAGSYTVSANVSAVGSTTLTSVVLSYSIVGGPVRNVPMIHGAGTTWTANIPYVPSPSTLTYNVIATDSAAHTKSGLCSPRTIGIGGPPAVFLTENLDGATDNGWTHGTVGDTSNSNDDWQRLTPAGRSGVSQGVGWQDPSSAFSGSTCWGNDLGNGSFNGAYQSNVHSYLESHAFDCSGRSNVVLVYKRWLTVEQSIYDTARILVNGTEVWRNQAIGNTVDSGWTTQSVNIAPQADNNPSVIVRFELKSDGGLELGGWQIDDLQLAQLTGVPPCANVTSLCSGDGSLPTACPCSNFGGLGRGCANSVNPQGALLTTTGNPNPDTLVLNASGMPNVASVSAIFLQGDAIDAAGIVFGDGVRCIDGTLIRLGSKSFPTGSAQFPGAGDPLLSVRGGVVPGSGAIRAYQAYYRNAAAAFCPPSTFNVGNAVRVVW